MTTMYDHFVDEEEKTRMERDTKSEEVEHNSVFRNFSYRFMP